MGYDTCRLILSIKKQVFGRSGRQLHAEFGTSFKTCVDRPGDRRVPRIVCDVIPIAQEADVSG